MVCFGEKESGFYDLLWRGPILVSVAYTQRESEMKLKGRRSQRNSASDLFSDGTFSEPHNLQRVLK